VKGYYQDHYLVTKEEFARLRPAMAFQIVDSVDDLNAHFAHELAALIKANNARGAPTVVILPVGPLQYRPLAQLCNRQRLSCHNLFAFMMDEYCFADGRRIPLDHPLSFRAFMQREFLAVLDRDLRPPADQVIFPDPQAPEAAGQKMAELGGVDICYGGIGVSGHLAFNDPPEPGEKLDAEAVRHSPTRVLSTSRETITQTALGGTGGNLELVPPKAVTLGMAELLAARELHLYFMRTWHAAVMRRALFGPVTPAFPGSFVQTHPRVSVVMTSYVAVVPVINVTQNVGA
jgi:glucosamine-6-phosphate deaminase